MRRIKLSRFLSILLVLVLVLSIFPMQTQAAGKVKLNKSSTTLYVGKTTTLKVSGASKNVKWSSSNKVIATVSSKGKVTARKKGTAIITARVGKKAYKCKVTVKNPYLNTKKKSMEAGKTYTLKLTGAKAKKYTSSNKKVATVNGKGRITAVNPGTATITCTDNNKKTYKCTITVTPKAHKHIWMDATCTEPKTCRICRKTEGSVKGHKFQWVTYKSAETKDNEAYQCSVCGYIKETRLDKGKETPWVYSNNGTHREKTMYDGTVLKEDLITYGNYSLWGWFDDNAASAMNTAVNYSLSNISGWQTFIVNSDYYTEARYLAFRYAKTGGTAQGYHMNSGGLPNVNDNRKYITLVNGGNQDNYIACFVVDTYSQSGDYTYGQYWQTYFGTYYASGNF